MFGMVWLCEIDFTLANGSSETVRLASAAFRPFPPTDPDRPSVPWDPVLLRPTIAEVGLSRDMSRGIGDTGGGVLEFSNADGAFDYLRQATATRVQSWRGQMWYTAFSDFEQVFYGVGESVEIRISADTPGLVRITIYDERAVLEDVVQDDTYDGSNVGTGGYEGSESDLKDKYKPLALGDLSKANIRAPVVNTSDLVHQISSLPVFSLVGIYDGGRDPSWTNLGNSTGSAFDAMVPTAGQYATDLARGYVKRGTGEGYSLTFDVLGYHEGGVVLDTAPQLIKWLLLRRGIPSSRIGASFDTVVAPEKVGMWLGTSGMRYREVIGRLLVSIGGWLVADQAGRWQIGLYQSPPALGSEERVFAEDDVIKLEQDRGSQDVPPHKVVVNYAENYTVMSPSDLAGAIRDTARAAQLGEAWRQASWSDPLNLVRYRNSEQLELNTALVNSADAQALADRWGSLFGVYRDTMQLVAPLDQLPPLGSSVRLKLDTKGFDKVFRVHKVKPGAPKLNLMTLSLWG